MPQDVDAILEQITDFASDLSYNDLPGDVSEAATNHLVDSIGCALGALGISRGCATAEIGMSVAASSAAGGLGGRILGSTAVVAADTAAFINSCLIRDLDFNDTYPGHHPSDCLGGILAVTSARRSSGAALLVAMTVSYEISIRLMRATKLNVLGWDNGYVTGIGVAAATAKLLGATREQIRHAVAITATANVPMRATRAGQLSMWKGAATAYSVRNAVFAAQLAVAGMTGPEAPFTGRHSLTDLITGPIEVEPFIGDGGSFFIRDVKLKYWPVVYNMQALVWLGIELRERLQGRDPVHVQVRTYESSWRESGSERAKWSPESRETADHSTPYILAYVLRNGTIDHQAFDAASYRDPEYRALMDRIEVVVDDDIEASYPQEIRMRLVAKDAEDGLYDVEISNPLGHERNRLSVADLTRKFEKLVVPVIGDQTQAALEAWTDIAKAGDVTSALDLLAKRDGA